MGCQTNIAEMITRLKASWCFNLKGNQGTTHKDVIGLFAKGPKMYPGLIVPKRCTSERVKTSKGLAHRVVHMLDVTSGAGHAWITKHCSWPGLRTALMVETFTEADGAPRSGPTSGTTYRASPCRSGRCTRSWCPTGRVETNHKILDDKSAFAEDSCKIHRGNAAEIMSIMRKLCINVLAPYHRLHNAESYGGLLRLCGESIDFMEKLLTEKIHDVGSPEIWRKWLGAISTPRSGPGPIADEPFALAA
jgi:predicted transposase YbfD/YdcC